MLKRSIDIFLSLIALLLLILPIILLALIVKITSPGPALYWSSRVGINNSKFMMPKFRSMHINTPAVATHLLEDPSQHLTEVGSFIRKTSLDELPQLWCILIGKMSFVGPRPALFNQDDLIRERTNHGVDKLKPGLTGWAQINGRDGLPILEKVAFDVEYMNKKSGWFDFVIIIKTIRKVLFSHDVKH